MIGLAFLSVVAYSGGYEEAVIRQDFEYLESERQKLADYIVPQESCGDLVMHRQRSLLKYAIDNVRWDVAEFLVSTGCKPHDFDERIDILLKCIEIDHQLIFAKLFDSEAARFRDTRNNTLLHFVSYCRADDISTWLNHDLIDNTSNDFGWTANDLNGLYCSDFPESDASVINMVKACDSRFPNLASGEIGSGRRELKDPYGRNLLELSVLSGCSAGIVSAILRISEDAGGPKGERIVALAVYHSNKEIVELLLKNGFPIGEAFLVAMDRSDRNEIIPALFRFADNYDISSSNRYGFNLGQLAMMRGQCGLLRYLRWRGIKDFGPNCRNAPTSELARSEYAHWLTGPERLKGGGAWAPVFLFSENARLSAFPAFLRQLSQAVANDIERLRVRRCDFDVGVEAVELLMAGNLVAPFPLEIRPLTAEYVETVGSLLDQSSFGLELKNANTEYFIAHLGRIRSAFDRFATRASTQSL